MPAVILVLVIVALVLALLAALGVAGASVRLLACAVFLIGGALLLAAAQQLRF